MQYSTKSTNWKWKYYI